MIAHYPRSLNQDSRRLAVSGAVMIDYFTLEENMCYQLRVGISMFC